mmetsp:Transcript_78/g.146  ORF Transcript_78/g.146 Transcript_78/m.146 type:complete len:357 (-) Transcript_78:46-1116(-)
MRSSVVVLCMVLFWHTVHCQGINTSTFICSGRSSSKDKILVVGATGTMGLRAVQGLLDVGYQPSQLQIITRNASKPKMKQLHHLGFGIVQADLQNPSSLHNIGRGCNGCFIFATGGDTAELDTSELSSARNLRDALDDDVRTIVYHSAAGAKDHGVKRIQQKHDVEEILSKRRSGHGRLTILRANLFMEELWKNFTRPQILQGKYPLPVHRFRKIYLTSVRDIGRLAGAILQSRETEENENENAIRILNVSGDRLTGPQIAKAFGKAQNSKCRHANNRELTRTARRSFPELYEQIRFLQTSKERTNIRSLKKEFPGLISAFQGFLEETQWNDTDRSFGYFSNPESLQFNSPEENSK